MAESTRTSGPEGIPAYYSLSFEDGDMLLKFW